MHQKHIHIVSFDIPYPANHRGIIDAYYKLKAMNDMGILIHLHCFEYGKHILTNKKMLSDTPFHSISHLAEKTKTWISQIEKLSGTTFSKEDIKKRKAMLFPKYSNLANSEKIKQLIFDSI